MIEATTLLLLYLSTALFYAAARERGRARHPLLEARPRARVARLAAVGAAGIAMWLWHDHEAGPAAVLVVCVGLMAMGTAVALLGPLFPRLVWRTTFLCLLAIPALAIGGVFL